MCFVVELLWRKAVFLIKMSFIQLIMNTIKSTLPLPKHLGILSKTNNKRVLSENIGLLWAACFSEKPMFRHIFQNSSVQERHQHMVWTMERRARLSLDNLLGQVLGEGEKGTAFWYPPHQKPGFHPLKLFKEGFAWVPFKFGSAVFQRMNEVSLHEIEVYQKHRKPNMWVLEGMAVNPQHQGQGIGSQLLHTTLEAIDARGEQTFVLTHNPENIPFYEKAGFELVEEMPLKKSEVVGYCFVR